MVVVAPALVVVVTAPPAAVVVVLPPATVVGVVVVGAPTGSPLTLGRVPDGDEDRHRDHEEDQDRRPPGQPRASLTSPMAAAR